MKRKRKIVIIVIVLLLLFCGILIGRSVLMRSAAPKMVKVQREDDVSRFQWLEMLCRQTGIMDYENETPYFSDVQKENGYFPYIQAAVEWELVQQEKTFSGDGYASGKFIAITSMKSIGERRLQMYLDMQETLSDADYTKLAIEHGLLEEKDLTRSYSLAECGEILEKLQDLYFGELWKDGYFQAVYQDGVTELQAGDIVDIRKDNLEITVTQSAREGLSIGNILVFEKGSSGLKMARKIIGIDASSNVLQLEEADVAEVLELLTCVDVVPVTFEDICASYGLTAENEIFQTDISNMQGVWRPIAFSPQFDSKGFKISLETKKEDKNNYLCVSVTDNATNISYQLPVKKKVSDKTVFTGEVDVDRITVGSIIDYTVWDGVKYAELAMDTHTKVKAGIQGEISSEDDGERIPLYKTQAPLGNGFLGVDIQVYLVISVQGEISFEAEIPVQASVCYEKGKGVRNFELKPAFKEPRLQVNCEADFLVRTEPTLVLLMCVNVLDAEADVGVAMDAELVLRANQQLCVDVSAAYPILRISGCGDAEADSLGGELGLSAHWELITKDNAPIRIGLHYEKLPGGTSQFVDACTYVEGVAEVKPQVAPSDIEMNHTYHTRFVEVHMVSAPTFSFDYPDGWTITADELPTPDDNAFLFLGVQEKIVLTNSRGTTITYMSVDKRDDLSFSGVGSPGYGMKYYTREEITKVADCSFVPGYPVGTATDYSDLGSFMVGKVYWTHGGDGNTGEEYDLEAPFVDGYAVIPESYAEKTYFMQGDGLLPGRPREFVAFPYGGYYCFVAEPAPGESFTAEEEQEIIEILSSFREEYE